MAITEGQKRERVVEDQINDLILFFYMFPLFFPLYLSNEFVIRLQKQKFLFLLQDRKRDRHLLGWIIWFIA
jgi:hypothetical protein